MDKIYRIHSFSADSISKMTNRDIQYIIDNVTFDYSIKIEPTLKSEFPEPSSGSDQQISCEKENKDSEFLETEDKPETVNEDNNISEKAEYLLEEENLIYGIKMQGFILIDILETKFSVTKTFFRLSPSDVMLILHLRSPSPR
ncbi:13325_t:CDS:2, partial [Ambispora gerdemannii]